MYVIYCDAAPNSFMLVLPFLLVSFRFSSHFYQCCFAFCVARLIILSLLEFVVFRFSVLCFFQYRSRTSTLSHAHAVSVNINVWLFPSYSWVFRNIGLSPSCPWVHPNLPWVFSNIPCMFPNLTRVSLNLPWVFLNLPCNMVVVAARFPLKHTLFTP